MVTWRARTAAKPDERKGTIARLLRSGGHKVVAEWRMLRMWVSARLSSANELGPEAVEIEPTADEHPSDGVTGTAPGSSSTPRRSPWKFVALVFALSLPIWLVGAITGGELSADLPVGALMVVCPVIAAAIRVYRESGTAGVARLLRRAFDFNRIKAKAWYVPTILLGPGVYASTYVAMRQTGVPVPDPELTLLATLAALVGFFLAGLGEELGWSGYAIDPLQSRFGALRAGLLLGVVWAVWHVVPLIQIGRSAAWIAWWSLGTVAFRVLLTWIYNNTGKSVVAAALCHAFANLTWIGPFLDFGPQGYPIDGQRISAVILAATAAVVTVVWGPKALTRHEQTPQAHHPAPVA